MRTFFLLSALGASTICLAGLEAAPGPALPAAAPSLSFKNDVLPVLSKVGCNQGTCHGSESGKGGFKLSLRGFAPELDHTAICFDLYGRRASLSSPEESLILRKPTLAVPHQGGRVLPRGSPGYRVVLEWLRQGAPGPREDEPRPVGLELEPPRAVLDGRGEMALRVWARFSDGGRREVTEWARYDSSDATVASIDPSGRVRAGEPGLAALSAFYQDQVRAVELIVPFPPPARPRDYRSLPRENFIDDLLIDRWEELRLWPSPPASEAALFRRISLDLTGGLPGPEEVRGFLAERRAGKLERAIDRLLDGPGFAAAWTQKWGDILRVSREWLGEKPMWQFQRYLRDRIERNLPWDEVVRELVAGAGNSALSGPPNFYRLQKVFNEPELWPLVAAETTAQTFLGVRIQCARCHNHPQDRWTQADYYGWVSFFAQVGFKMAPPDQVVIHDAGEGEIPHPRLGRPLPPRPLDGPPLAGAGGPSRRQLLASWITAPGNPFFARATANRVWRHFMGRGLVEPVDDFRASNPPSDPALLDALARELVEHRFDIRHLIRTILASRAYRLSSTPAGENRGDARFYSHYRPKRMTAEQLFDALGMVTGSRESFAGLPADLGARELPDTRNVSSFLDGFGRPLRRLASCECERVEDPNLGQALELMNSSSVNGRVAAEGSLVERLLQSGKTDPAVLEEVYLRALGRPPAPAEAEAILSDWEKVAAGGPAERRSALRREFFEDLLWATLNSREFLFNH